MAYSKLDTVTLSSGEQATIARITAPDQEWADRIVPFLGHKGRMGQWQIKETLAGSIDQLESHYYIAHIGIAPITNVATWEYCRAGILGHVFTNPDHRKKGAARAVMARQMADFRARGGRTLFLGTGFDTHPYHLYASFGFQSVYPESGFMQYYTDSQEEFEAAHYLPGATRVRGLGWHDWAGLTVLGGASALPTIRMYSTGLLGRRNFETPFIEFFYDLRNETRSDARVLEQVDTKSVVGLVYRTPDRRYNESVDLLDLMIHPNFADDAPSFAHAVSLRPGRKTQAYVGSDDPVRRASLEALGFRDEAILRHQINLHGKTIDVAIMAFDA